MGITCTVLGLVYRVAGLFHYSAFYVALCETIRRRDRQRVTLWFLLILVHRLRIACLIRLRDHGITFLAFRRVPALYIFRFVSARLKEEVRGRRYRDERHDRFNGEFASEIRKLRVAVMFVCVKAPV